MLGGQKAGRLGSWNALKHSDPGVSLRIVTAGGRPTRQAELSRLPAS